MRVPWRRAILTIAAAVAVAVGSSVLAGPASAQTVETGSLSFTGDPGDPIAGGRSYSYGTAAGDMFHVFGTGDNSVEVRVTGTDGYGWSLTLAAPSGVALTPGTYTGATRASTRAAGEAGIELGGSGGVCDTIAGSFTVDNVEFGPYGYVEKLDATYEQRCDGAEAALRGEVHVTNPPAPPALDLGLSVSTDGTASTVSGNATVHGSVTCTQATTVTITGYLVQTKRKVVVRGRYNAEVSCMPGTPAAWTATAVPDDSTPFRKGAAQADSQADAWDSYYGLPVLANDSTVVTLHKTKA